MFDYEKIPVHWINRLGFLVRKELGQIFAANNHQIGPEEWAIMLVLWKKGPQLPSVLADLTLRDRTTITRIIDKMEQKGFVSRKIDSQDGRRSQIAATLQGEALKLQLVPLASQLIEKSTQGIAQSDLDTTLKTLQQMTKNLLHEHKFEPKTSPKP